MGCRYGMDLGHGYGMEMRVWICVIHMDMYNTHISIYIAPPHGNSVVCGGGHTEGAPQLWNVTAWGDAGAPPAVGLSPTLGCDTVKVT